MQMRPAAAAGPAGMHDLSRGYNAGGIVRTEQARSINSKSEITRLRDENQTLRYEIEARA
jgi:hypothetical protein